MADSSAQVSQYLGYVRYYRSVHVPKLPSVVIDGVSVANQNIYSRIIAQKHNRKSEQTQVG